MDVPESAYHNCTLCPRSCGVDRTVGETGFCRSGHLPRLAAAVFHRGEEPSLTTGRGSGTMFFSGCTLRCDSCQNYRISRHCDGSDVDVSLLCRIMVRFEKCGATNINFVTGTHFAPSIVEAVGLARKKGMTLPTVWNTSGYESMETLELLSNTIDIWLPDIKTFDTDLAAKRMHAADYPDRVRESILWMIDRSDPMFDGERLVRGTICRHLVVPGFIDDTESILRWYGAHAKDRSLLSVMAQYVPVGTGETNPRRQLEASEYNAVLALLDRLHIEDGYVQELEHGADWLPDFNRPNPFPADFADPLWSWQTGFTES